MPLLFYPLKDDSLYVTILFNFMECGCKFPEFRNVCSMLEDLKQCDYDDNVKSPLCDASGVYRTDTQELSPPEGSSYVVTGNNKPRERGWAPRPSSAAPGWAADTGGLYRDKHQPEASDPELLTEQGHDNSTHIVVELFTAKRLSLDVFMYFVMSQCQSVSCGQGQFNSGSADERKIVLKL